MQWMGILHWSPDDFWNATFPELNAAIDGWKAANGANQEKEAPAVTMDDFERMKQKSLERQRKKGI